MITKKQFKKYYTEQNTKPKLFKLGSDWTVLTAILLLITAHTITTIYLEKQYDNAKKFSINQKAVTIMESNPIARLAFETGNIASIANLLLGPSLLIATYLTIRKTSTLLITNFVANTLFFIFFFMALNDIAHLIGALA